MQQIVYVFWTESNDLTPRRKNNLEILRNNCGVELKFLNHETIQTYELPDNKFHPAYQYLSATAKSDYLRSYFMNFHGGAYCDIKRAEWNWSSYFNELENSDKWIMGYRLPCDIDVAVDINDPEYDLMKNNWYNLIGAGAMICKPNTPMTQYWFQIMTDILDAKLDLLRSNPAKHVRDKLGWVTNSGYPLRWSEIGPETFMKSCFKYRDKLSYNLPRPELNEKYR